MPNQSPKRGALPSPRSKLAAAVPYAPLVGAPPHLITIPQQISMWGNDVHGDCVTAEEAFAKACNHPEIFIPDGEVIAWATKHGVLEGAFLPDVMTWMQNDGFVLGNTVYDDGSYLSVDWTNTATVQSAIARGPVKLGIAANQLENAWNTTGGLTGWFGTGWAPDSDEDHCVSLCGYGTLSWLATQLGVSVPGGVDPTKLGYAMFTWDSIGIVDVQSMINVTQEAWLRQPTTVVQYLSGSELACFGVGGTATRLYYLDAQNQVNELGWESKAWHNTVLPGTAAHGSALTCFGVNGTDSRVYYLDAQSRINELAWEGSAWHNTVLPGTASPGSALTCFAVNGSDSRVYYLDGQSNVNELAWEGHSWHHSVLPGAAAPGSALTCFGLGGADSRVYYLDDQSNINELAWEGNAWQSNVLPGTAAFGSALTCFGAGGTASRVYYLDAQNRVNELSWESNAWHNNVLPGSARAGSALTCFGFGGDATRLYYLGGQSHVNELAWENNAWHNSILSGTGRAGSALTCFGVGGTMSRVYYLDAQNRIHELSWANNAWHDDVLPGTAA